MLRVVENQTIEELVILDTEKDIFYPIEDEGEVQIGEYKLKTEYKNSSYEIAIESVGITE